MKYLHLFLVGLVGCGSAFGVETGDAAAAKSCLANIPASCPNCMTMNASDEPTCEDYLACYLKNQCSPSDACGQDNGVCGVNAIGGGSAPQVAAIATYKCACP